MAGLKLFSLLCVAIVVESTEHGDYASLLQSNVRVHSAPEDVHHSLHKALTRMNRKAHMLERKKAHAAQESESAGAVRLIDFTYASIVYNNLGGQGPQKTDSNGNAAPEEIRYSGLIMGQDTDLVVTAAPGYEAFNPSRNGFLKGNGQVNAKSGTNAHLTFKFVKSGTYNPVVQPLFYFTFSDIDERHGGSEAERISVVGYDTYYTNDDLMQVNDGSDVVTFQSSDYGNYSDNQFYPDSPSPLQLSHAVTYKFTNKASFDATFSIEKHRDFNKGRNVLFSGISQLVFCQQPSVYLDFSKATVTNNNLGGAGPQFGNDQNIRYSNIASDDGGALDLVVSTDQNSGYTASNVSNNGLHGAFGHINLYCGPTQSNSQVYLTFKIVRSGTYNPVVLPQFALVVFDFDMGLHEQQQEFIEVEPNPVGFDGGTGYSSYILTETTEIAISHVGSDSNRKTHFAATKHGTEADNPTSPQNMARETADKSVVLTFRSTSTFKMTLGITPTGQNSGRNFMFSGQDMYLMCD